MKKIFLLLALVLGAMTMNANSYFREFVWHGFSMNYLSNYVITDKDYDDMYSFTCEIPSDDFSMMHVRFGTEKMLSHLEEDDAISACVSAVDACLETMDENVSNLQHGEKAINSSYKNIRVLCPYTYTVFSMPIYGYVVAVMQNDAFILLTMQAETEAHLKELLSFYKTIHYVGE